MDRWRLIEREGLADDARVFRMLIAQWHDVQAVALQDDAAAITEAHVLSVLAPAAAGRHGRLARQLLAYAGSQGLAPVQLELLPYLSDLAYVLRRALDARIEVLVDVGHDCPPCHADRQALDDALLNLVANARDAMPEGGLLWLRARACDLPDARPGVEISVADSGAGMGADAMNRAGQPFFTTKTGQPLAGMGLAATNGFAQASSGVLALQSPPSRGLTVGLRLPQSPPAV